MTELSSCLSKQLGPLGPRVEGMVQEYAQIWHTAPVDPPILERVYRTKEKKGFEQELTTIIDRFSEEQKKHSFLNSNQDAAWMESYAYSLRVFFKKILGHVDLQLDTIYDDRFVESTRQFLKAAREFDPEMGIPSVYQALRNVWIMNSLQYYLGIEVKFTSAVFGYSMVYPYLDNLLDDVTIPKSDKGKLLIKLKGWLEGDYVEANTAVEQKLFNLIYRVEQHFPRALYPGVYQSMLTIFNGQIRSLLQHSKKTVPCLYDTLAISLEKGGTSVLADGYLVAGNLNPRQENFCFGFGTFLQLADDLQDIAEDLENNHMTLFSQSAGQFPLDRLVYKLFHFMSTVLEQTLNDNQPQERNLREVIFRSCALMYKEAVGKHSSFFTRKCVKNFQAAFPVRFSYLRKLRQTLEKRFLTGQEKISDLDPASAALLTLSSRALALD